MRLKKVTCGAAVLGMSAGLCIAGATGASAATTTIRPYLGFNPGTAVGQTNPGVWDSETCAIARDDVHTGNNGKINNITVPGHTGELNVTYTFLGSPSHDETSCDTVDIGLTGSVALTPGTKPGGTVAVTTAADVQGGIAAISQTTIDVTLAAGQVLKQPAGSAVLSGTGGATPLTGPGTARILLKASSVKTKATAASPASCSDAIYVMDTTNHDVKGHPIAKEWDGSTIPAATSYFATIRSCAGDTTNVPGKPVTTKLSVSGDGAVSVSFYEANTINPQTWDQTQGTCSVVKTTAVGDTFGSTALDVSRVLQCKGDYAVALAFSIDVRAFSTNGGQDPNGLLHPASLALGGGTFSN